MAFLELKFKSKKLGKDTCVNVILPDDTAAPYKTVYLLHGLSDDYSAWARRSLIERYAQTRRIAVIMPDAAKSFYCDMKYGEKYFSYITEELIDYTREIFPLSKDREDTFAAGLSMGGYGAFKIALSKPEIFSAAASLSGCLDIVDTVQRIKGDDDTLLKAIMGEEIPDLEHSRENVIYLAKELAKSDKQKPRLYQACGTSDFLYSENQTFKNEIEPLWDDYKYVEGIGSHTWEFWNKHILKAIDFFLKK